SLLAEEDERFARLVKAKLDELLPDVERLKQAEDWSGAEEKLGEFERVAAIDPERYLKTAALKAFNDEIDEVILLSKAEAEFKKLSRKARAYKRQEELAKAIGFLESFPEDYSNTSYHAKIREQVDEYLVLYKAAKEKEQATLSIEWEQVEIDKYLSSFTKHQAQDAEVWAGVDGTVEGVNDSDGMAQLEVGTDDWKEWILELEVKVPDDQDLNLGITSGIPPGRRDKNYERQRLEVETDTWITLRVEIREGIVKIIDVKSLENIKEPYAPYFSSGSFAVMLQPGEKVFLRNIRYKTLTKAGAENGEAGGEDEEVGDGEGGDGEGDGDAR
ncbi:MAG: hypothetical protein ACE5GW_12865, partial [Planctomycetota bacterium]